MRVMYDPNTVTKPSNLKIVLSHNGGVLSIERGQLPSGQPDGVGVAAGLRRLLRAGGHPERESQIF